MSKKLDIAMSRIDSFLARCARLEQRIRSGLTPNKEDEFSEKELKDLDLFLLDLATGLMDGEKINDEVWKPPSAASLSNFHRSNEGGKTGSLQEFSRSLQQSKVFFGTFVQQDKNEARSNSIESGDGSQNIIVNDGGRVEVSGSSGSQTLHRPTMQDITDYDPKTKALLDKAASEKLSSSESSVQPNLKRIASHINGWALVVAAIGALAVALDGVINNWGAFRSVFEFITSGSAFCDPDILSPTEYDQCIER